MGEYKNVLFKDSFIGTAGYPPDKGKWFAFLTRENNSVEFTDGMIEPTVNGCRFGAAVDSNGWGGLNLMSRAEFKVPFKIRVAVKPTVFGFYFYLLSPDIRDGHFLGTEVYGMWVAALYGTTANNKFQFVVNQDYSPKTNTSAVSWSLNTEYIVEMEVTAYASNTRKLNVDLSVKLASDGSVVWQLSDWCDESLSGTLRCAFSARANAGGSIEFYAKSLLVFGNQSRKARAVVSAVTGLDKRVITDDVMDFRVALRDGSHPQASLTIKNEGNKYDELSVKSEIEIRAGTEAILYLLFRGYIEAPERTYPPSRLKIESGKGYAKRLDFREAYAKVYTNKTCGFIVKDLIKTYFDGVFSYDNVLEGIPDDLPTSAEYNAVTVSKIIKELADACVFVWGVDFNKAVYFMPFSLARSQSSIPFKSKCDQFNISNRDIDEVVNYVHQVGKTSSGAPYEYTAHDSTSESSYWRRDKTFKDTSLSSQAATQAKAQGLLQKYKVLTKEIALTTKNIVPIDLYCMAAITNTEVGLNEFNGEVKSVEFSYSARGVKTTVLFQNRGFKLADALVAFQEALSAKDSGLNNAQGGGTGEEEEPPPEEEFGFITISLANGYLHSLEQALFGDSLFLDWSNLSRFEDKVHCNSDPQASLVEERRQLEFSMVESLYLNHGGTKQIGETWLYVEAYVWSMNENYAGSDVLGLDEGLTVTNE
jgi:hypothetical protein